MRRDQWHASADDFSTVNLKGIGDIIAIDLEGDSDTCVNESIDPQFCLWVVSDLASGNESTSKNALVSFQNLLPVSNKVIG